MTAPIRPAPREVDRWVVLGVWLRRLDAVAAWLVAWGALGTLSDLPATPAAALSAGLVALGGAIFPLRVVWRPVSGAVGLLVSRGLRPGDRAWYVRSRQADLVLVTARRGSRLVIATPDPDEPDEVLTVRRTRVLLVPADVGRPDSLR